MKTFIKAYRTKQRMLSELWDCYQTHNTKVAYYTGLFMDEEDPVKASGYLRKMEAEAKEAASALTALNNAKKIKVKCFKR